MNMGSIFCCSCIFLCILQVSDVEMYLTRAPVQALDCLSECIQMHVLSTANMCLRSIRTLLAALNMMRTRYMTMVLLSLTAPTLGMSPTDREAVEVGFVSLTTPATMPRKAWAALRVVVVLIHARGE